MRPVSSKARNRPQVYAGHGAYGSPADGYGTGCCGVGKAQDITAGKRYPPTPTKGGEEMTDAQLDTMVEAANAQAWEEQNRVDPKREALSIAAHKAIDLLKQAFAALGGAVDEDSVELDAVLSYCNDIEDMVDSLNAERWAN